MWCTLQLKPGRRQHLKWQPNGRRVLERGQERRTQEEGERRQEGGVAEWFEVLSVLESECCDVVVVARAPDVYTRMTFSWIYLSGR